MPYKVVLNMVFLVASVPNHDTEHICALQSQGAEPFLITLIGSKHIGSVCI